MTVQWWAEFLTTFILIRIGIIAWRRWKGKKDEAVVLHIPSNSIARYYKPIIQK